jgi:hemerythrin-like domain-containing protein
LAEKEGQRMGPTETLKEEHRAIERMLAVMDTASQRLEAGEPVRTGLFRDAVDFVRNFADKCHHDKEESNLFPRLQERGLSREEGPLAVMLQEHDLGRNYIRALDGAIPAYEQGDKSAASTVAENARGFTELLRDHIWKENNILFPMADRVLTPADQQELEERFEQVEAEDMGPGVHQRYHELLEKLELELAD